MGKSYMSYTMALILHAVERGYSHGFDVMTITGLASGTVYPALRRLEDAGFLNSKWEQPGIAQALQRPARKYYEITKPGRTALTQARERFRLSQLEPLVADQPVHQKG
ncbi:MAG TPA: PadR family transcriptional regulator [Blastocatellia bacterium]|nr:PadR family transcriptional regulator [Blastocatellia bacterium]